MEYISLPLREAAQFQDRFKSLVGSRFTSRENKLTYTVAALMLSPADEELMKSFKDLVTHVDQGIKSLDELSAFVTTKGVSEFTPVIFAKADAEPGNYPGDQQYIFIPLQYLVDQNGDLKAGFDIA